MKLSEYTLANLAEYYEKHKVVLADIEQERNLKTPLNRLVWEENYIRDEIASASYLKEIEVAIEKAAQAKDMSQLVEELKARIFNLVGGLNDTGIELRIKAARLYAAKEVLWLIEISEKNK